MIALTLLSAALAIAAPAPQPGGAGTAPTSPAPANGKPATAAPPLAKLNATDIANQKLAAEALKLASKPEGVLPLIGLLESWDASSPKRTLELIEKLAADPRLPPARAVLAKTVLAQARARLAIVATEEGDATGASGGVEPSLFNDLGFVSRFRVIGPFDNEGKSGFDTATPVEENKLAIADMTASYPGKERAVRWRDLPERAVRRGYVPLGALLRPRQNACALAETIVHSEVAQPLTLWAGAGGAVKIFWNGEEVLRDEAYRQASPERAVATVAAHKGSNRVLAKVCVTNASWGFFLRIGDAKGGVAKNVRFDLALGAGETAIAAGHDAGVKLPKAVEAPLATLERLAAQSAEKEDKKAAAARFTLARFLRATGADDPAERRAKQLAARAAEIEPTLDHLELAAELAEERSEVMRFADQAYAKFPKDPRAILLHARVVAGGPVPEDALPLIEQIGKGHASYQEAQLMRAEILSDLELAALATRVVKELRAEVGDTVNVLRELASLYQSGGDPTAAIEMHKQVVAQRVDDIGSRRVLIADALQRGATADAHEHLDAFADIAFGTTQTLLYIASIYDALGRDDLVLATYRAGIDLIPEAPELFTAYGRALLHADQPELAAEAFQQALVLKPQDAPTRELLEQIRPRVRPDEAYAVAEKDLLALRVEKSGYPSTTLSTLRVNTVYDNGLGSSFFQYAAQVHDDEGARQHRTFPIQYDPDAQRVDVRLARVYRKDGRVLEAVRSYEQALGEPWYRIYYDTRALVVVFPDLEPGDTVELRYRVDDVAHRNQFADYYGDLHPMQGFTPTQRSEYVLITPTARKFYIHEPKLEGLAHTQTIDGARRIDRWRVDKLPAIVAESGMPGVTEISPYLHVSTYESWQDVGRWYWGLIRDQLYADASLKRTVAELVKGAKTTQEKVQRVQHWVVSNTRYVGLEFGIHGFLPYRVPLIVQRGFGDCKDKASLLYTMLREAGVDARIVLVRTRRNGAIAQSPASLAVFDHAIAYVPELDMFIDGTAEHSGTRELPVEDQGVTVLVVGPKSAELKTTPVQPASASLRTRTLKVQLASDGSAEVEGDEMVAGAEAAGYREHYEAVGTRKERFERAFGELYPGLTLDSFDIESLSDLESPVRYKYKIKVPQLATLDGQELRLAPSTMKDLLSSLARLPARKHTLDLHGNRTYREERAVQLPKGMAPAQLPSGGEASSAFGTLRVALSAEGSIIKTSAELELTRDKIPATEYPAFRKWVQAADELLRQRIGIKPDREEKAP